MKNFLFYSSCIQITVALYQLHVEQMVRNGNRIALTEQRTLKKNQVK
jgi:hypothetical protein